MDLNSFDVRKCAKDLELMAVRQCMVMQLYRKSIVRMFSEIRTETNHHSLHKILAEYTKSQSPSSNMTPVTSNSTSTIQQQQKRIRKTSCDIGVQAEFNQKTNVATMTITPCEQTLNEKIRLFEIRLKEEEIQRKQFHNFMKSESTINKRRRLSKPKPPPPPPVPPPVTIQPSPDFHSVVEPTVPINESCCDDDIEVELEKLFGLNEETNTLDDIFGEGNRSIPILTSTTQPTILPPPSTAIETERAPPPHPTIVDPMINIKILKDSIWPCELHMRRLNYRNVLLSIADKGYRHNIKVKNRIFDLFGEDSDDEELPLYSPTISDSDEILRASCKKRLAPIIVRALMEPLNSGRIASRAVFKNLAKRITDLILRENTYPTEGEVRHYVDEYFAVHSRISCMEEIT